MSSQVSADWIDKGRVPGLDGMRGISILLVLFCHFVLYGFQSPENPEPVGWLIGASSFSFTGDIGVTFFFVISGFIITLLLLREEKVNGKISLSGFYYRRAIRILPAYFVYLLVLGILSLKGTIYLDGKMWLHLLTYTINYTIPGDWAYSHIWSLSVEEHFYLVWPFLFYFLGAKHSFWIAALFILITPLLRWLSLKYDLPIAIRNMTPERIDAIFLGCCMAIFRYQNRQFQIKLHPDLLAMLAICLLLIDHHFYLQSDPYVPFHLSAMALALSLLLWTGIHATNGLYSWLLKQRWLIYIGTLSYSLYLWQQLFLNFTSRQWWNIIPLNIVLAFTCAIISYHCIEQQLLTWRSRQGK